MEEKSSRLDKVGIKDKFLNHASVLARRSLNVVFCISLMICISI